MDIGGTSREPLWSYRGSHLLGQQVEPLLPLNFFLTQPPTLKWKEKWPVQENKTRLRSWALDEDPQL